VGQSYVPIDFVVQKTGGDDKAPIILGRPFLSTVKAIIYMNTAKICFTIKDKKKFLFKVHILYSPAHPQKAYLPKETTIVTKKKKNRRRNNKTNPSREETINIINTI
jgi:hypothetical protein